MFAVTNLSGFAGGGPYIFNATIAADAHNYNVKTQALAAGWNGASPLKATITINSGVVVGSTSTGTHSFDTGSSFPANCVCTIINNGKILGKGGAGGNGSDGTSTRVHHGFGSHPNGYDGGAGGPALRVDSTCPTTVYNNDTVGGGGGGGGGGGTKSCNATDTYCWFVQESEGSGGGGGQGSTSTSGGSVISPGTYCVSDDYYDNSCGGYAHTDCPSIGMVCVSAGGTGTSAAAGSAGAAGTVPAGCAASTPPCNSTFTGASGCAAGTLGNAGSAGSGGSYYPSGTSSGGAAGAGGACTSGNAYITWAVTGNRYGSLN